MLSETYLSPEEAAAVFPGCPRRETIWRYARKGVRCKDGRHIFLDHIVAGGKILIPEAAIEPFVKAVTAAKQLKPPVREPLVSPAQVNRSRIDVAAILKSRGLA